MTADGSGPAGGSRPAVWAHRGASAAQPENTVAAFAAARDLGADGVELDVHRSADGHLVVHHDADHPTLGVLARLDLARIRAEAPEVPTLEEALDACGTMTVNIEVKNLPVDPDYDPDDRAAGQVAALVAERGLHGRVIVSSFNLETVDRVRRADPAVPTGLLTMGGFDPLAAVGIAHERGHVAIHPLFTELLDGRGAAVCDRAHELGLAVNTWTVDDPARIVELAEVGVDAVITNVPDVARRALGR